MPIDFCSLASGSSGNCQFIRSGGTKLLLDAGLSGKYIKMALDKLDVDISELDGILVTHEHSDHIQGVGVLQRKYGLKVYTNEKTFKAMQPKIGDVDLNKIIVFENYKPFEIKDLWIEPYSISHDASDPVAYCIRSLDAQMGIATDLGQMDMILLQALKQMDFVVLESNHSVEMLTAGKYPYYLKRRILSEVGHLSNDTCGDSVAELVRGGYVKSVLLGHLSKENNLPELAYETVRTIVEEAGIRVGKDVAIDMTYRDRISPLYRVKRTF
jgi:phosphoribosyl 1,2-cyclic phosphodiesterase